MLIKRAVLMLLLQPYLIGTTNMIADLFTKALDKGQFSSSTVRYCRMSGQTYGGL